MDLKIKNSICTVQRNAIPLYYTKTGIKGK